MVDFHNGKPITCEWTSFKDSHCSHMDFLNALYGYPSRTTILSNGVLHTHPQCYKQAETLNPFAYQC